jgi:glycosyltransferase involved in cell wall biosynthesis
MNVVHVVAGLWKDTGGPSEVIPALIDAQNTSGIKASLYTLSGGEVGPRLNELQCRHGCVTYYKYFSSFRVSIGLLIALAKLPRDTIIHCHGVWLFPSWACYIVSIFKSMRLVITPHGALTSEMYSNKRWKKFISFVVFEYIGIRNGKVHFLSEMEKKSSQWAWRHSSYQPVVVGNGVEKYSPAINCDDEGNTLLFLSRIASVKGINELIDSWKIVSRSLPSWRLKIVGPCDDELVNKINDFTMDVSNNCEYVGPVYGEERFRYFLCADVFILPTKAEGYPTVILESLAHGCPVITTKESNVNDLIEKNYVTIIDIDSMADDLLLSLEDNNYLKNLSEGMSYVIDNYDWGKIVSKWLYIYSEDE